MRDKGKRRLGLLAATVLAGPLVGAVARRISPRPGQARGFGGRAVEVFDEGEGPVVLLIHGLFGNMLNFSRLIPQLGGFRVLAYDRRGAGRSASAPKGGERLEAQAALAAEMLEAAGGRPAIVVGHSLGGAVALQLAADRPDLVAGLVTLGALTRPMAPQLTAAAAALGRATPLREALARGATQPLMATIGPPIALMSFAPDPAPAGFMIWGGGLMAGQPRAVSGALRDLDVADRGIRALQPRLGQIEAPALILHGREDDVVRFGQAEHAAATLPHAELRPMPGGHMMPVIRPKAVAAAIREMAGR
ncbi:alpha/beta fold hydrolase [Paracoccus sp. S-4012]|uniref:alpha/beta fold hydrolase n=1 Tax=Paracoccus sp. S-4012 TaxID=2665648 RepID=UPI0012AFC154|nr:alpha/beta hydrolase [Paracoccus sp. S-4012]MRX49226.1 alpha/beta fold hydrolase [Paracoccus sp. S-4012]